MKRDTYILAAADMLAPDDRISLAVRLGDTAYWLAVRAGVAGRRAERRDAVAELREHVADPDNTWDEREAFAWAHQAVTFGWHVGAARAEIAVMPREGER